jgi:predicted O-methyltransferase YrrM
MLGSIKRGMRGLLRRWVKRPLRAIIGTEPAVVPVQLQFAPPGHYYSPFPDLDDVERNAERYFSADFTEPGNGIDLNEERHERFLEQLAAWYPEYDLPDAQTPGCRFFGFNHYFSTTDALALYGMMRLNRPRRIIEVGSGYSSGAMLEINDRYLDGKVDFTFIEPDPDRLNDCITPDDRKRCRFIKGLVQDVPFATFAALEANDILFIDSSHVGKIGSDVNYLLFHVLPRLQSGVIVHVHDINWPFEYPKAFYEMGRAWNEVHLLRAFLMYNSAFRVEFWGGYAAQRFGAFLHQNVARFMNQMPGSIWIRKN